MNLQSFEKLFRWQYPFFMLASLALAYFKYASENLTRLLLVFWCFYGYCAFRKGRNSKFKILFTIVLLYVLLSISEYAINGLPIKLYINDFRGVLLPMLVVYIGFVNSDEKVYRWLVLSTVFCVVIGMYLYFVQPNWYLSFLVDSLKDKWYFAGNSISESDVMLMSTTGRFSSFFTTSYVVTYFSMFSLCIVLNDLYKDSSNRLFKSNFWLLFFIVVLLLGVILSVTRVAVLYAFILLLYYFVIGTINKKKNSHIIIKGILFFVVLVVIIIFTRLSLTDYGSFVVDRFLDRLSLDSASELLEGSSRMNQVQTTLSAWGNILLGDGMGARGGAARASNLPGVTDENWVRLLAEYGIIGFVLFIMVFGYTVIRGYKLRKYYMTELTIIMYGLLSMFVADTLSKGCMIVIFWFAIGRIWNKELYFKRIQDKNYI